VEAIVNRRSSIAASVALIALLAGCDFFRPAQPEAPTMAAFLPDYRDPDSTLATIGRAIADKGVTIGGTAYDGAFADSTTSSSPAAFHQFFSPEDLASWNGTVPPDWGFELEQHFYTSFIRLRPDGYNVAWVRDTLNPDDVDVGAGVGTIHRHYFITTHSASGPQTSVQAIGFADLRMLRFSDGNWRIVLWNDRRDIRADPNDPTLGRRRLNSTQ
jgi:hypothetical protein